MKVRVFQMVTAVAEFDKRNGNVELAHGAVWPSSGFFPSCDWRSHVQHPQGALFDHLRGLIAEHLNTCPAFGWGLLPTPPFKVPRSAIPDLTARDVLPGSNLDTDTLIHFGVTTDEFDV